MTFRLAPLAASLLLAAPAIADPPVTDPTTPPPGPAQAARWVEASFHAPFLPLLDRRAPGLDAARMLVAVQRGERLGPGVGWYGPSGRRHTWSWLAARHDADGDGQLTRGETKWPEGIFDRLDRDRDGAITAADLDWSEKSDWVRRDADALKLLRAADGNGNGRITEAEWREFFERLAGGRDYLSAEDVRRALAVERQQARKVSNEVWLRCLVAGDLGSPFDGPGVGRVAPDFILPTHDGKSRVTLSDFRGKKPVVLSFGSFT